MISVNVLINSYNNPKTIKSYHSHLKKTNKNIIYN